MSSVSTIPASPLVGVNVDQCERLFVAMFSEPENKVALAEQIVALDEPNKARVFRGKDVEGVLKIQNDLAALLVKSLGVASPSYLSNNNNRVDSDLFEQTTNTHIEIKIGSATDAAVGGSIISMLLGEASYAALPGEAEKAANRALYAEGKTAEALQSYRSSLAQAVQVINSEIAPDSEIASGSLTEHVLNMLYSGINQEERISSLYHGETAEVPEIQRYSVNPKGRWKRDVRPALTSENVWKFKGATLSSAGRLSFIFTNNDFQIRFVFNQKNRYSNKSLGIVKAPGIYGLGSGSFNVWVKPLPRKK